MPIETDIQTLKIGGQELRVAQMGPRKATRTMLVFNGIGASLDTVEPFAESFKKTRIITFDVPGVGGSPVPLVPYRMTGLARMAAQILDALEVEQVDVFGVSWGGALAQQFAHDYPERCHSLVLAATSAGYVMVPGGPSVLTKMATPKRYFQPDYMMKVAPHIYGGLLRGDLSPLLEHADRAQSGSGRGYLYQMLAGMGWTSWFWLPQIKTPTLVLAGDDDPIVPMVNGVILAERLPNSTLEVIQCGHMFILTLPEETAARIEAFIHE